MRTTLPLRSNDHVDSSPYQHYVYAYPHKTAYRPLKPSRPLQEVWADEARDSLSLYVHIPFCGMRCGFCNLFTSANPHESFVQEYLDALEREGQAVREGLENASFARFALGGGTPTYLNVNELERVLNFVRDTFAVNLQQIPGSVEVSPETVTIEKLALLRERGLTRLSMGVQSFIETETMASGRPQKKKDLQAALQAIQTAAFPIFNLDLIYGLPGQTVETWLYSLQEALRYQPQEIYLYPLYVRPLTGLDRRPKEWDDQRLKCYRNGRDFLLASGYEQVSMRMFQLKSATPVSTIANAPDYCCQEDGMVGIGCGARSYTRDLHYSQEYAVGASSVREILRSYVSRAKSDFGQIDFGFSLSQEEQKRRYLLQSLLNCEGLDTKAYQIRFESSVEEDFPTLENLQAQGDAVHSENHWRLTATGLEKSDAIGPSFFSDSVQLAMSEYAWR